MYWIKWMSLLSLHFAYNEICFFYERWNFHSPCSDTHLYAHTEFFLTINLINKIKYDKLGAVMCISPWYCFTVLGVEGGSGIGGESSVSFHWEKKVICSVCYCSVLRLCAMMNLPSCLWGLLTLCLHLNYQLTLLWHLNAAIAWWWTRLTFSRHGSLKIWLFSFAWRGLWSLCH